MIKTWAEAETGLAKAWPGFQPREQQRKMAGGVTRTVHGNSRHPVLMAQAGCGVGKSLGYLIPTLASGGRTIVSVSTKALQDQLVGKDLPALKAALFPDLEYAVLKGRSNYVCRRAADKSNLSQAAEVMIGSDGERSDLHTPVSDEVWREMSVDAEGCVGRKACPFAADCFSEIARKRALDADVLVVNTSLLTQDLKFRGMTRGKGSLLGDFNVLVVDEAHEMADIVAGGLSTRMTMRRIADTMSKLAYHLTDPDAPARVAAVLERSAAYFNSAQAWFGQQKKDVRTAELEDDDRKALVSVVDALAPILDAVSRARCSCEPTISPETGEDILGCEYHRRTDSLMNDLVVFADSEDSANVVWMETGRGGQVVLCSSPAEVGGWLDAVLWNAPYEKSPRRAVLTSATLGVGGDFTYTARRLGLSAYEDLDVGSPFDYGTQARLYLPLADAPNPGKQREQWLVWAQDQTADLIDAAGGGALLLFTSTAAMKASRDALVRRGYAVMMQGDGVDNRTLAARFAADRNAILFATRGFMTGVDFAGDTCRLVVIDKMPFPVPDEPVFKARCKRAEDRFGQGASFRRVSIPEMSLVLIQAFGRLIRTVDDTGVVAILDPRMRAGWASSIRRSLPPAPTVGSVAEVSDFYRELADRRYTRKAS